MARVTETLNWVVEINSDYPAMIEIDKVDAKAHLAEIDALRDEVERLRDALRSVVDEYYEPDNGRSLRWEIEAAIEALK